MDKTELNEAASLMERKDVGGGRRRERRKGTRKVWIWLEAEDVSFQCGEYGNNLLVKAKKIE